MRKWKEWWTNDNIYTKNQNIRTIRERERLSNAYLKHLIGEHHSTIGLLLLVQKSQLPKKRVYSYYWCCCYYYWKSETNSSTEKQTNIEMLWSLQPHNARWKKIWTIFSFFSLSLERKDSRELSISLFLHVFFLT